MRGRAYGSRISPGGRARFSSHITPTRSERGPEPARLVYFERPPPAAGGRPARTRPRSPRAASAPAGSGACDRSRAAAGTPRAGSPSARSRCRPPRRAAAAGARRWRSARPAAWRAVLALDPHAADQRQPRGPAGLQTIDQPRRVGRIVLAVAVEGHHDRRAGGQHAGAHRAALAGVALAWPARRSCGISRLQRRQRRARCRRGWRRRRRSARSAAGEGGGDLARQRGAAPSSSNTGITTDISGTMAPLLAEPGP